MIAFRVSLSFKNCSKFAFIQKKFNLSLALSQTNNNYKSKKTAFLNVFCLFSYENVFHDGFFITILFDSLFSLFSYLSLALVRFVVRSRFTKIHTKNYCSTECVCVLHLRVFCVSVLFSFLGCGFVTCRVCVCVCVWFCCSIKSLIWYKFHR